MDVITKGLFYEKKDMDEGSLHIVKIHQLENPNFTLLISKISEAILPNTIGNHIGEGATLDTFLNKQSGVRFIINGGFSHYRKNFYEWPHQNYLVGDPVGQIKIRHHFYNDFLDLTHYGFFTQKEKGLPWEIVKEVSYQEKYILGCTPLLIFNQKACILPNDIPLASGIINPPSYLGHGLENHPRTGIGIKGNYLYFIIKDGQGCSLKEFQEIGLDLNLDSFINLDGGGSSQFKLKKDNYFIENAISKEDKARLLGHALVLFDETLKN